VEEQAFGDRQWFRPASERQRYQLQAKKHSLRLIKRPLSRLPVSPIIIERLRLLSVPKFARCSPTLGFARQETYVPAFKPLPKVFLKPVGYLSFSSAADLDHHVLPQPIRDVGSAGRRESVAGRPV